MKSLQRRRWTRSILVRYHRRRRLVFLLNNSLTISSHKLTTHSLKYIHTYTHTYTLSIDLSSQIFLNGNWVGIHQDPQYLLDSFRTLRRDLGIDHEVSAARDIRAQVSRQSNVPPAVSLSLSLSLSLSYTRLLLVSVSISPLCVCVCMYVCTCMYVCRSFAYTPTLVA